jgi:hypothetical protein
VRANFDPAASFARPSCGTLCPSLCLCLCSHLHSAAALPLAPTRAAPPASAGTALVFARPGRPTHPLPLGGCSPSHLLVWVGWWWRPGGTQQMCAVVPRRPCFLVSYLFVSADLVWVYVVIFDWLGTSRPSSRCHILCYVVCVAGCRTPTDIHTTRCFATHLLHLATCYMYPLPVAHTCSIRHLLRFISRR